MPLPTPNAPWPPPWADRVFADIEEWSVWWEGISSRLANYYRPGQSIAGSKTKPPKGIVARAGAFFSSESGTAPMAKDTAVTLHVPIPGDIARISGALMYSNPPLFRPEPVLTEQPVDGAEPDALGAQPTELVSMIDPVASARLDELMNNDRTQARLLAHGETVSALGGGVLRVVWDEDVDPTGPWIEDIDADQCIPEYVHSKLVAITFFTEYHRRGKVYRHFERYIRGGIEHALYEGDDETVGERVPLTELSDVFESIIPLLDEDSTLRFEHDGLAAVYVPNRRPHAPWRKNPKARQLGGSDFSNDVLPLFAAVDEVFSSLMRDVRIGKGRMIVSEELLQTLGTGRGTWLDADAEYVQRVGATVDPNGRPLLESQQFAIREGAHLNIITALLREILRRVGISPLTFGISEGLTATTATEIRANTRDTISTVLAKRRLASPELRDLAAAVMDIDREFFGGPGLSDGVDVIWPPEVPVSDLEKAQTLTLLADSMSLFERVRYLHDDWDDEQIRAEVERIQNEAPAPVLDPFGLTEGPPDPAADEPPADDEPTE